MRIKTKIISIFFCVIMFSFITIPVNAAITVNETKISNFQQDVSFSRLEKGMDIIIIKNGNS